MANLRGVTPKQKSITLYIIKSILKFMFVTSFVFFGCLVLILRWIAKELYKKNEDKIKIMKIDLLKYLVNNWALIIEYMVLFSILILIILIL